jgi:hypothetical protein
MVVLCTFSIAQLTTFPAFPDVFNMGPVLNYFLFKSGFVGVYITVCLFQLLPSLFAKQYPLKFLNISGIYSVIYLALAIESIGIIQFLYAFVRYVEHICYGTRAYRSITSDESTQLQIESAHDKATRCYRYDTLITYFKYIISTVLVGLAVSFLVYALSYRYSSSEWPLIAQIIILISALIIIFYCEGLKIAIVSASSVDMNSQTAQSNYGQKALNILNLLEKPQGGVKRFLLGRQMIVVPLGFIVAQITHFGNFPQDMLDPFTYFLLVNIGLPGILTLLIFSQLAPQLLAEAHSNDFMSLPGSFILVYVALAIEKLGITSITPLILEILQYDCGVCKGTVCCIYSKKKLPSSANNYLPSNLGQQDFPIESPIRYAETGLGIKCKNLSDSCHSNELELKQLNIASK